MVKVKKPLFTKFKKYEMCQMGLSIQPLAIFYTTLNFEFSSLNGKKLILF